MNSYDRLTTSLGLPIDAPSEMVLADVLAAGHTRDQVECWRNEWRS